MLQRKTLTSDHAAMQDRGRQIGMDIWRPDDKPGRTGALPQRQLLRDKLPVSAPPRRMAE
jgi:hypothetical protein